MVAGSYLLSGSDGPYAVERFTWATGRSGFEYAATRCDPVTGALVGRLALRLDAAGATTRLHVEAGSWVLRGGCVGEHVLWRRGEQEGEAVAAGFTGSSPAFVVAAVRMLGLAVGQSRRLRLVAVTEPVLSVRLADQGWTRRSEDAWEVDDLATGERRHLRLVDGLVVDGTGITLTGD